MKKFHIDRLEKLYNFLGTIKPKKFYWGEWAMNKGYTDKAPDMNVCGTTACALGWAASMPEFRKRGLKLVWYESNKLGWVELRTKNSDDDLDSEEAGAEFFGLTNAEADELFIPNFTQGEDEMTLGQYRKRLRKFIDRKRRELKVPA
jgi:hypothetical protein